MAQRFSISRPGPVLAVVEHLQAVDFVELLRFWRQIPQGDARIGMANS